MRIVSRQKFELLLHSHVSYSLLQPPHVKNGRKTGTFTLARSQRQTDTQTDRQITGRTVAQKSSSTMRKHFASAPKMTRTPNGQRVSWKIWVRLREARRGDQRLWVEPPFKYSTRTAARKCGTVSSTDGCNTFHDKHETHLTVMASGDDLWRHSLLPWIIKRVAWILPLHQQ